MNRIKDAFDNIEVEPEYMEPTNEFDGHVYHADGTKSFADGAGIVNGVNSRA